MVLLVLIDAMLMGGSGAVLVLDFSGGVPSHMNESTASGHYGECTVRRGSLLRVENIWQVESIPVFDMAS